MNVSVSRQELDAVVEWLELIAAGGDAEAEGRSGDEATADACAERLADFAEFEQDRGADIITACRGIPVLVEVIMEADSQRMMEALMGACAGVLPNRKVAAIRCLVSIGKVARHRGAVAGSGVLGLVSAASVGQRTPPKVRALCFEAIGVLASDDDVEGAAALLLSARGGVKVSGQRAAVASRALVNSADAKRSEEFQRLRQQAMQVGSVDAMCKCLRASVLPDQVALCTAASTALASLATSADVAPVLLRSFAVPKCLALLNQRGVPASPSPAAAAAGGKVTAPSKSKNTKSKNRALSAAGDGSDGSDDDDDTDFDYGFACERPALRLLQGILKVRQTPPTAIAASSAAAASVSAQAAATGGGGEAEKKTAVKGNAPAPLPPPCAHGSSSSLVRAVCSTQVLDALLFGCLGSPLEGGGGEGKGRGKGGRMLGGVSGGGSASSGGMEAQLLALDCLRRLVDHCHAALVACTNHHHSHRSHSQTPDSAPALLLLSSSSSPPAAATASLSLSSTIPPTPTDTDPLTSATTVVGYLLASALDVATAADKGNSAAGSAGRSSSSSSSSSSPGGESSTVGGNGGVDESAAEASTQAAKEGTESVEAVAESVEAVATTATMAAGDGVLLVARRVLTMVGDSRVRVAAVNLIVSLATDPTTHCLPSPPSVDLNVDLNADGGGDEKADAGNEEELQLVSKALEGAARCASLVREKVVSSGLLKVLARALHEEDQSLASRASVVRGSNSSKSGGGGEDDKDEDEEASPSAELAAAATAAACAMGLDELPPQTLLGATAALVRLLASGAAGAPPSLSAPAQAAAAAAAAGGGGGGGGGEAASKSTSSHRHFQRGSSRRDLVSQTSHEGSHEEASRESGVEALLCADLADSLTAMLTAPRPACRTQALYALRTLTALHTRGLPFASVVGRHLASHVLAPPPLLTPLGSGGGGGSGGGTVATLGGGGSTLGAALRAASCARDLSASARDNASELAASLVAMALHGGVGGGVGGGGGGGGTNGDIVAAVGSSGANAVLGGGGGGGKKKSGGKKRKAAKAAKAAAAAAATVNAQAEEAGREKVEEGQLTLGNASGGGEGVGSGGGGGDSGRETEDGGSGWAGLGLVRRWFGGAEGANASSSEAAEDRPKSNDNRDSGGVSGGGGGVGRQHWGRDLASALECQVAAATDAAVARAAAAAAAAVEAVAAAEAVAAGASFGVTPASPRDSGPKATPSSVSSSPPPGALSSETVQVALGAAAQLKAQGNELFGSRLWVDAASFYESALELLDDCFDHNPGDGDGDGGSDDDDDDGDDGGGGYKDRGGNDQIDSGAGDFDADKSSSSCNGSEQHEQLKQRLSALRVALHLNVARCFLKLGDEGKCLSACAYAEAAASAATAATATSGGFCGPDFSDEAARRALSSTVAVASFLRAQLWWTLSGGEAANTPVGAGAKAKKKLKAAKLDLPAPQPQPPRRAMSVGEREEMFEDSVLAQAPWPERRQHLRRARDVLKASLAGGGSSSRRATQLLLRSVQTALNAGSVDGV